MVAQTYNPYLKLSFPSAKHVAPPQGVFSGEQLFRAQVPHPTARGPGLAEGVWPLRGSVCNYSPASPSLLLVSPTQTLQTQEQSTDRCT